MQTHPAGARHGSRRLGAWLLALAVCGAPADAKGQVAAATPSPDSLLSDVLPFAPLAQPSRFWPAWRYLQRPGTNTIYEAETNMAYAIFSKTKGLSTGVGSGCRRLATGTVKSGCTLTFNPHFVLRQLDGGAVPSAPVRTPTFNPTLDFTYYRAAPGALSSGHLHAMSIKVGHYSNGSDGCLYENEVTPDCTGIDTTKSAAVNLVNGSFSTHFIEASYAFMGIQFDDSGIERFAGFAEGAVRSNPGGWVTALGGMDSRLAQLYGRTSVRARVGARWRTEGLKVHPVLTLAAESEWFPGRAAALQRSRQSIELLVSTPHLYGLGIAGRYIRGADYYNIAFAAKQPSRVNLGLVFDHTRAVTHTASAARRVLQHIK